MQKSKDMITSQLPKVTCYNKVVKKGNTSNNSLYIYIYYLKNNWYQAYKTLM